MEFAGSFIIFMGGFDFVFELADGDYFIVTAYLDLPFFVAFGPINSFVFRG
jgi:hypothetical protein